jgi:putative GTP pyrophosphokinase
MNNSGILSEYDDLVEGYDTLCQRVCALIEALVNDAGLHVHSIQYRVKARDSLRAKLSSPDTVYEKLTDLTDIAAVRVVTYFAADVDCVAQLLQQEFTIDHENSVDMRAMVDPDRFGYISLHYVISFSEDKVDRPDSAPLAEYKVEVQIRSILQHAWAEIEHDLGYKSKHAIPVQLRRRFSRLSGLLELADDEFDDLRDDLRAYAKEIETTGEVDLPIDKISLSHFIKRNALVRSLDEEIETQTGLELAYTDWFVESLVDKLLFVDIPRISALQIGLEQRNNAISKFAIQQLSGRAYPRIHCGISIFYFCTQLLAESQNERQGQTSASDNAFGESNAHGNGVAAGIGTASDQATFENESNFVTRSMRRVLPT